MVPALPPPSLFAVTVEPPVNDRFPAVMEIAPPLPCPAEAVTVLPVLWNAPVAVMVTVPASTFEFGKNVLLLLEIFAPLDKVKVPTLAVMLPAGTLNTGSVLIWPPHMLTADAVRLILPELLERVVS